MAAAAGERAGEREEDEESHSDIVVSLAPRIKSVD
jgi:hypothetical protein